MALLDDRTIRARLSAERALLGEISPSLRAVALAVDDEQVQVRCYFDGPASVDDEDAMSSVEAEMIADCEPGESVTVSAVNVPVPTPLENFGVMVYRRKE